MKIFRRKFFSRLLVLLYRLRPFNNPFLFMDIIAHWFSNQYEMCGIRVYAVNMDRDITAALQLLQNALKVLSERSPRLVDSLRRARIEVIVAPVGPGLVRYLIGRRFVIDVLKYMPDNLDDNAAKKRSMLLLLGDLVSMAQEMRLYKGRFGYFGIKHMAYLNVKARIRILRKCLSPDNQLEALTVMAMCYKVLDDEQLRPGRRYYPFFMQREMEKFSFGRKLKLHPESDTLVIEEKN